jgi:hypothetical protein
VCVWLCVVALLRSACGSLVGVCACVCLCREALGGVVNGLTVECVCVCVFGLVGGVCGVYVWGLLL